MLDLASAKVPHIRPVVVALLVVTATVTVTVRRNRGAQPHRVSTELTEETDDAVGSWGLEGRDLRRP